MAEGIGLSVLRQRRGLAGGEKLSTIHTTDLSTDHPINCRIAEVATPNVQDVFHRQAPQACPCRWVWLAAVAATAGVFSLPEIATGLPGVSGIAPTLPSKELPK